jgi:hypothetical protein
MRGKTRLDGDTCTLLIGVLLEAHAREGPGPCHSPEKEALVPLPRTPAPVQHLELAPWNHESEPWPLQLASWGGSFMTWTANCGPLRPVVNQSAFGPRNHSASDKTSA